MQNVLYITYGGVRMLKRDEKQFYSIKEVAEILDMHYTTIWRLIQRKEIPASKVGKIWRIPCEYVDGLKGEN